MNWIWDWLLPSLCRDFLSNLLVIKAGFMGMILKPYNSLLYGKVLHPIPRKPSKWRVICSPCSSVSSKLKKLSLNSLSILVSPSVHCFSMMFWGICGRKWEENIWKNGNLFYHHDNVSQHTAFIIQKFLARNKITHVPHPLYSPNHTMWLFLNPKIGYELKRAKDLTQ